MYASYITIPIHNIVFSVTIMSFLGLPGTLNLRISSPIVALVNALSYSSHAIKLFREKKKIDWPSCNTPECLHKGVWKKKPAANLLKLDSKRFGEVR